MLRRIEFINVHNNIATNVQWLIRAVGKLRTECIAQLYTCTTLNPYENRIESPVATSLDRILQIIKRYKIQFVLNISTRNPL